jgi:hypothetical protein
MASSNKRKNTDGSTNVLAKFIKLDESTAKQSTSATKSTCNPPNVVRLRRLNGKIVQDCDIYIGRACNMGGWRLPHSKWHNPYSVKQYGRDGALHRYRTYIESNEKHLLDDLHELAGKTLGCWCKPNRCHGDILRELYQKTNASSNVEVKQ